MHWIAQHWLEVMALALLGAGVWWLMPRAERRPRVVGLVLAAVGLVLLATGLNAVVGPVGETVLFVLFATPAILCAILMITDRKPVYSALWFALSTLSVCGLFLLQLAPFLAAATVIVFAGAIVVTFVYVIMLAQQSGETVYDQRSRHPLAATLATFVLLAALIGTLQATRVADLGERDPPAAAVAANPLSQLPADGPLGTIHGLGRSLFGDFLLAVEMAAVLLLVATIGAALFAPRRQRGTL